MKYVVLIYSNPAAWASLPAEEADRVLGKLHYKIIEEMKESRASSSASRASRAGTTRRSAQFQTGFPP